VVAAAGEPSQTERTSTFVSIGLWLAHPRSFQRRGTTTGRPNLAPRQPRDAGRPHCAFRVTMLDCADQHDSYSVEAL